MYGKIRAPIINVWENAYHECMDQASIINVWENARHPVENVYMNVWYYMNVWVRHPEETFT